MNTSSPAEYHKRYYEAHKEKWQTPEARAKANQRSRARSKEERARLWRNWYAKNRDVLLAKQREDRALDPEVARARHREFWRKNAEQYRQATRDWAARLRAEVLSAYGNECACCGETAHPFLTLDHINRDGKAHRLSLATRGGQGGRTRDVYLDLKRRGWPKDGYRLLCMNCNFATRYGDPCPHELEAHAALTGAGRA